MVFSRSGNVGSHPPLESLEEEELKVLAGRAAKQEEEAKVKYDSTGTFHWCPPREMEAAMLTRASNIPYTELRHVVILGNYTFLTKEWPKLRNLPKLSLMEGSPLNRADLRAISVNTCRTCILLSSQP